MATIHPGSSRKAGMAALLLCCLAMTALTAELLGTDPARQAQSAAAGTQEKWPAGYTDTPYIPDTRWRVHDINRPHPRVVTPGSFSTPEQPGRPPSDAIILFDGTDLSHWESAKDGGHAKCQAKDGD